MIQLNDVSLWLIYKKNLPVLKEAVESLLDSNIDK